MDDQIRTNASAELPDEALSEVNGGVYVGQRVLVNGMSYRTSFCDPGDEKGVISGYYYVQKYIEGRRAPILLSKQEDRYDTPYGNWVKEEAIL